MYAILIISLLLVIGMLKTIQNIKTIIDKLKSETVNAADSNNYSVLKNRVDGLETSLETNYNTLDGKITNLTNNFNNYRRLDRTYYVKKGMGNLNLSSYLKLMKINFLASTNLYANEAITFDLWGRSGTTRTKVLLKFNLLRV